MIQKIRAELAESADEAVRISSRRFFKEPINCYGVRAAGVRAIAKKYWKEVSPLSKGEIFALCEELFRSDRCEEALIVGEWVPRMAGRFSPEDLPTFAGWIERYVNNWAACDSFCNRSLGDFVMKYPERIQEVVAWTGSGNRWMRRAAAVSLIVPARRGKFLPEVFQIADRLLTDGDDMVQKGYGWLLKEASRLHQQEVFDYVVKNRTVMPRTALRYAIELMPAQMRAEAMRRG